MCAGIRVVFAHRAHAQFGQAWFGSAVCTVQLYSHGGNQWTLFAASINLSIGIFSLQDPPY